MNILRPTSETPKPAIPGYPYGDVAKTFSGAAIATERDGVLRTVGMCVVLPPRAPKLEEWTAADAQAISRFLDPFPETTPAAARGKFVLLERSAAGDRALCYQVKGNSAEPVWCGNSMAGTSSLLALISGKSDLSFEVLSQDAPARATAHVERQGHRFAVHQEWQLEKRADVEHKTIGGFKAVECTYLNPYLVIAAPVTTDVSKLYAEFAAKHGLQAKLLVLDDSTDPPGAYYYNLNGRHGAAPMTGLVTLGYLRTQVDWIDAMLKSDTILTPSSYEAVPKVTLTGDNGCKVALPDVNCELHALSFGLV